MINVNKITSVLARMPDQQLQQYAEMHKNDPYIVSLALSESNRRKEMRSAGQGTQGEQPKVVDQLLAAMPPRPPQPMPENVGIGALPVANMDFAEGGIIAFGDGGNVERYQFGGNTNKFGGNTNNYNSLAGDIPGFVAGTGNAIPQAGDPNEVPLFRRMFRDAAASLTKYQAEQNAKARIAAGVGTDADKALLANPQTMAQFDAATDLFMTERANKQAASNPAASVVPVPAPATKPEPNSLAAPAAPAAPTAPTARPAAPSNLTSVDALQKKYFGSLDEDVDALKTGREGLVSGIKDLAAENLKATEADIAKRGDVFKGREERLSAQEKRIGGMDTQNTGLALLQAGAAMMSTPGGLGVALGKGVAVGSERYAAGIDKINAAKDKFADARDRLDDLRINRDDMNDKDIRAAKKEVRESTLKGQELLYNGLSSDLGIKQKNISSIFSAATQALNTQIEQGGQNARSAAQIAATFNTPDRLVFNQLLLDNGNNPVAAAEALQKMKAEKFNTHDAYSKYLQTFAGKDTLKEPEDFDVFAKRFIPTVTPNKNTPVRTQPGG